MKKSSIGHVLELSLKWHKLTYAATFVASIVALALLPQVRFDYNLLNLQDQQGEAIRTFRELLTEPDHSPWHAFALAEGRAETESLAQRLAELPEVSKVVTLLDFVPGEQDEKLVLIEEMALTMGPITLATGSRATGEQVSLRQRQALDELSVSLDRLIAERPDHASSVTAPALKSSLASLFDRLDVATPGERKLLHGIEEDLLATLPVALQNLRAATEAVPFKEQGLPESLSHRWRSQSGEYRLAIYPAEDLNDNNALRRFVHAVQRVTPNATGAPMVTLEAGEAVVHAFVQAFLLALAGIIVALLIVLRSFKYTVLVLIPIAVIQSFHRRIHCFVGRTVQFREHYCLAVAAGSRYRQQSAHGAPKP